jgi:competence CoiA-like predicted nuclease
MREKADYLVVNCINEHGKLTTVLKSNQEKLRELRKDGMHCPTCDKKVAVQFFNGPA